MTEAKVSRVAKRVAEEWQLTSREADYLVKKLSKMRHKVRLEEQERMQEYADLYGCVVANTPAKTKTVQAWQQNLYGSAAEQALDRIRDLERIKLRVLLFNAVETMIVDFTAPLGGVERNCLDAAELVNFFKKVKQEIKLQKFNPAGKLGRCF
jgi:hypothetical protein